MKSIPDDVKECSCAFKDDNFYIVKDPKHRINSFHYTAWAKDNTIKSILDLQRKHIPFLKQIIEKFAYYFKIAACNYKVLVHFPPNFWRFHIHFVDKNHKIKEGTPKDDIFNVYDIIKNLEKDEDYYIKRVKICKL
jgi:m7GpppX diphosphatase